MAKGRLAEKELLPKCEAIRFSLRIEAALWGPDRSVSTSAKLDSGKSKELLL
jgi:hypothetical protein